MRNKIFILLLGLITFSAVSFAQSQPVDNDEIVTVDIDVGSTLTAVVLTPKVDQLVSSIEQYDYTSLFSGLSTVLATSCPQLDIPRAPEIQNLSKLINRNETTQLINKLLTDEEGLLSLFYTLD